MDANQVSIIKEKALEFFTEIGNSGYGMACYWLGDYYRYMAEEGRQGNLDVGDVDQRIDFTEEALQESIKYYDLAVEYECSLGNIRLAQYYFSKYEESHEKSVENAQEFLSLCSDNVFLAEEGIEDFDYHSGALYELGEISKKLGAVVDYDSD